MGQKHKVPESFCRQCGLLLSGAAYSEDEDRYPEPGDLSVCIDCYTVGVYDESLKLVEPPAEMMADPEVQKQIAQVIEQIKRTK